jgi:ATP-dependent exoDNAse (exonuclease V) alpha subunit
VKQGDLSFHNLQFPICAGYTFTDHKAQGQTLEHVIVDIGTTVKFPVNPFAAYVALSRSHGRDTIRLLRDFDETIFTKHPSEYLRREDERLAGLIVETADKFKRVGSITIRTHPYKTIRFRCVLW